MQHMVDRWTDRQTDRQTLTCLHALSVWRHRREIVCPTSGHKEGELSKLFAWHSLCWCRGDGRRRLVPALKAAATEFISSAAMWSYFFFSWFFIDLKSITLTLWNNTFIYPQWPTTCSLDFSFSTHIKAATTIVALCFLTSRCHKIWLLCQHILMLIIHP